MPLQGSGGPFPARLAIVRFRDNERADEQRTHLENESRQCLLDSGESGNVASRGALWRARLEGQRPDGGHLRAFGTEFCLGF
jgi:hypothetical protein